MAGCVVSESLVSYVKSYHSVVTEAANRKFGHNVFQECAEQVEQSLNGERTKSFEKFCKNLSATARPYHNFPEPSRLHIIDKPAHRNLLRNPRVRFHAVHLLRTFSSRSSKA